MAVAVCWLLHICSNTMRRYSLVFMYPSADTSILMFAYPGRGIVPPNVQFVDVVMLLVPLFGSIIANSTGYVVSMGTIRQYGPRLFFLLFCECSIPDMG